jgi:hypothetical protein
MPPRKDPLVTPGRSGAGVGLAAALAASARLAFADHPIAAPPAGGFGWLSWLLVAGAVVAVGLAAWAFFAPDDADASSEPAPTDRTGFEPPAR